MQCFSKKSTSLSRISRETQRNFSMSRFGRRFLNAKSHSNSWNGVWVVG